MRRAWGGAFGGMLHKLSSHSACIACPTVLKAEWNVGQTPPPLSFCISVCILFFSVTNITALWIFGKQKEMCGVGSKPLFCLIKSINYNIKKAVWQVL